MLTHETVGLKQFNRDCIHLSFLNIGDPSHSFSRSIISHPSGSILRDVKEGIY